MRRELPVRFREGLGVKLPRATRLIITGTSEVLLEYEVKPLVEHFLSERGLELSHEKTRITRIEDGFDFLGQTVRRYDNGKVLIKPSKSSVKAFLASIREVVKRQGGHGTAGALIRALNQQIEGWTMYHRHACSKRTFSYVDNRIFRLLWRWCRRRHPSKPRKWVKEKYFKRFGNRDWVFTGSWKDSKGRSWPICLQEAARVSVRRHVQIRGEANPYDPEWESYFEDRLYKKMQASLQGRGQIAYLHKEQQGRCRMCGEMLEEEEEWNIHHRRKRSHGGSDRLDNLELLHGNCHRQLHSKESCDELCCVSPEALEQA